MSARAPDGRTLTDEHTVTLTRLTDADLPELCVALDDDRVFAGGYAGGPAGRPRTPADWGELLFAPGRVGYAVRRGGEHGEIVGTSSLGDVEVSDERLHLGWTAYAPAVWATAVNPATKMVLLTHAFDDCGMGRVKIQCDARNARSAAAIAKLGATREGVLRRHKKRADGSFRDTIVFSVLREEWPGVREGLRRRLEEAA